MIHLFWKVDPQLVHFRSSWHDLKIFWDDLYFWPGSNLVLTHTIHPAPANNSLGVVFLSSLRLPRLGSSRSVTYLLKKIWLANFNSCFCDTSEFDFFKVVTLSILWVKINCNFLFCWRVFWVLHFTLCYFTILTLCHTFDKPIVMTHPWLSPLL